jgi:hypothetical protein
VWYAILALAFLLVSLTAYQRLAGGHADPDQFWHIATGQWIVQHGTVPTVDVFSWYATARHAGWTAHEWLFGVVAYELHHLGGYPLLYGFTAALDGALFVLAFSLSYVRSKRPFLSLAIATLVIFGTYPNLAPRPQMFTFCFVLVIALLGEKKKLWWSLPIVLLAANLHGGAYPIYLVVIAFYAFPDQLLVLPAAAAMVLVNPQGWHLLPYALGIANPDAAYINEFRPTALATRQLDLAVYLGIPVLLWGQKVKLKDGILVFALVMLSLSAVRQVAFVYILALPLLAPYVPALPARRQETAEVVPEREGGVAEARVVARPVGVLDIAPVAVLALSVALAAGPAIRQPIDVTAGYPAGAVEYVRTHHLDHVWNIWQDGGYMISVGVPPMVDGRGDPYMAPANHGVDMAHDYFRSLWLEEDPHGFLETYGVKNLIVNKGMTFYRAVSRDPAMTTLYEDGTFVVMRYKRVSAVTP